MNKASFWAAAGICLLISSITLYLGLGNNSEWLTIFIAFLPVCFFMVGDVLLKMNKEILQLQHRIEEIEKKDK